MANKFDYQNMLNKISDQTISKTKTPQFTDEQIDAWNAAIRVCYSIVDRRRIKFETTKKELLTC